MAVPYVKGLHEVGPDVWAWLAPDGSWGWSNAGLIAGAGESLLVDTLFDLRLTRELLAAVYSAVHDRPLTSAVNTHANGDHCYGNELLDPSVRIYAAGGSVSEMEHVPPALLATMTSADLGPVVTPYIERSFGPFQFDGITLRMPDVEFDGELTVDVGGREVRLIDLGPAHTAADTVVHVPDADVLFTGDLLFIGGTPIMWTGPVGNWIAACDAMLELRAGVIVPGHGPVTDDDGVRAVRGYFTYIEEAGRSAHARGESYLEAASRIDLGPFASLGDAERIVVTMYALYRDLDPSQPAQDALTLFGHMAAWEAARTTR
jgi:glyoxylase-like metal-dependent hydrolase (beta-lactamase superfamily II)